MQIDSSLVPGIAPPPNEMARTYESIRGSRLFFFTTVRFRGGDPSIACTESSATQRSG